MGLLYSDTVSRPRGRSISHGAVAHLGERFNGIEEVGGSSPPSSTLVARTVGSATCLKADRSQVRSP